MEKFENRSARTCAYDRHTNRSARACAYDRHTNRSARACAYDRHTHRSARACAYDRHTNRSARACAYDRHTYHLPHMRISNARFVTPLVIILMNIYTRTLGNMYGKKELFVEGLLTVREVCTRCKFPENEGKCIDINPQVGLSLETYGTFKNLWGHVATGPNLVSYREGRGERREGGREEGREGVRE